MVEPVIHKLKHTFLEEVTKPTVSIPATGALWSLGNLTPEQWLTYFSIVAVIIQILISVPKLIQSYRKKKRRNKK